MYRKVLCVLLSLSLFAGCQQKSELDELMEENPFRTDTPQPTKDVVIISCDYYPLALPFDVDVKSFASWPADEQTVSGQPDRDGDIGFSAENIRLWKDNGIHVGMAPLEHWSKLRDDIIQAGGQSLGQSTCNFRNIQDVGEFPTFWVGQSRSLFVTQTDGALQGYTLSEGDCLFMVQCIPWQNRMYSGKLRVSLLPVFRSSNRKEKFVRDEMGQFKLMTDSERIVFDQLKLEAIVAKNMFICLATAANDKTASNLGDFFMRGHEEKTKEMQFVVILVPSIKTADEIKAEIE